jgi:hypothetical protein
LQQVEDRHIGNPDDGSDDEDNGGKAKGTKGTKADQTPYYRIHYDRWHRRFDEWVPESRLIPPPADKVSFDGGTFCVELSRKTNKQITKKQSRPGKRDDQSSAPHSVDRQAVSESKHDDSINDHGVGDLQSPPGGSASRRRRGNPAHTASASVVGTPTVSAGAVAGAASTSSSMGTPQTAGQGASTPASSYMDKQPDDPDVDDEILALAKATAFGLRRETRRSWHASLTVAQRQVHLFLIMNKTR